LSRGIHSLWQSGTAAERGAYTTTGLDVPFHWWETDNEAHYWWTGTGWAGLKVTAGQALNITTGGTLALGGFTLTVPATGTAVIGGGSGAANRVALWSNANTLTSSANLTFTGTLLTVTGSEYITSGTLGVRTAAPTDCAISGLWAVTAAPGANQYGIYGTVQANIADAPTARTFHGLFGNAYSGATQNITSYVYGVGANVYLNHTSTIDNAGGFRFIVYNANTGTVGAVYNLKVESTVNSGGGTINNLYGLYIYDMTVGTFGNFAIVTNAGNVVFNEGANVNSDLRHEGNTNTHLLFSDAGLDRVGINRSVPAGKLDVYQSASAGAIPVLKLEQLDVSEEFIRLVGSAAAGVLTQSIVAEADVTTATRVGWAKVYVQDDGNQIPDSSYYVPLYTLA
jgi:hypothetical protein